MKDQSKRIHPGSGRRKALEFNKGRQSDDSAVQDLKNLIITSEAVTRAALLREESRGAHTRLDFEGEREEGLGYNIIIKKTETCMQAEKVIRESPPKELEEIAHASLEEL